MIVYGWDFAKQNFRNKSKVFTLVLKCQLNFGLLRTKEKC